MLTDLQIATAQLSELANGFLGVQIDGHGDEPAVTTFQLHHTFGFVSRPRDPDVRGNGCSVLYGYEGDLGHAWLCADPRYTPKLPATKAGGSTQYCVTLTGAVSYAAFDGDDGSYLLKIPEGRVDVSGVLKVGAGTTQAVALGPAFDLTVTALRALANSLSGLTGPLAPLQAIGTALTTALSPTPVGPFPTQTTTTKFESV
jgi:hypothetical protein